MTDLDTKSTESYLERMAAKLPFPLAESLFLYCQEEDPSVKFAHLLRVGYTYTKWLSLICVSNYHIGGLSDNRINDILGGRDFQRPLPSKFHSLVTAIPPLFARQPRGFIPTVVLALLVKPNGEPTPVIRDLGSTFLKQREVLMYSSVTPKREVAIHLLNQLEPQLLALVRHFEIFVDMHLHIRDCNHMCYIAQGPNPSRFESEQKATSSLATCVLHHGNEALPLFPLILSGRADFGGIEQDWSIFLYDGLFPEYVRYTNAQAVLMEKATVRDLEDLQKTWTSHPMTPRDGQGWVQPSAPDTAVDLMGVRRHSEEASRSLLDQHRRSGKYHQDLYHKRKGPEEKLDKFADSSKTVLLLVAASGAGKTNLLCEFTRKRLEQDDIFLHFYARNYEGQPFARLIEESLHLAAGQIDHLWASLNCAPQSHNGRKVFIVVDAINEYERPEKLFGEVMSFVRGTPFPWLKVIVSCRPLAWKTIERQINLEGVSLYAMQMADGSSKAYLDIGSFSKEEAEEAFAKYVGSTEDVRRRFGLQILTPWEGLSPQVQELVQNPIMLRFVCVSYDRVPQSLLSAQVLQEYIDKVIDKRFKPFLSCFCDLLWDLQQDYVTDDDIIRSARNRNPNAAKLHEYLREELTGEEADVYSCINPGCATADLGRPIHLLVHGSSRCPECERPMKKSTVRLTSVVDGLVDEGIVARYDGSSGQVYRFLYDRLFEAMMSGKILAKVLRTGDQSVDVDSLFRLTQEKASSVLLHDALKDCLLLVCLDQAKLQQPNANGLGDSLPECFIRLCTQLIREGTARSLNLVEAALIEIGRIPRFEKAVASFLMELSVMDVQATECGQFLRTALAVGGNIGIGDVCCLAITKGNADARILGTIALYSLWRASPRAALGVLQKLADAMFVLGWPKFRIFEAAGVASCAIQFESFADEQRQHLLGELKDLWKRIISRCHAFPLAMPMIALLGRNNFAKIPTDYNVANWAEFCDNHKYIRKSPELRGILEDMLCYVDPDYKTMQSFRDIAFQLARLDEGTTASWSFFGFAAIARYPHYPDEVFDIAIEFSRIAHEHGRSGVGLAGAIVINQGIRLRDEQYHLLKDTMEKYILATMGRFRSLRRTYCFPMLMDYMRIVNRHEGLLTIAFVQKLVDDCINSRNGRRPEELLLIVRNLEVLCIEAGASNETYGLVGLLAIVDIAQKPVLPQVRARLLEVLAKTKLFYGSQVEAIIDESLKEKHEREEIKSGMQRQRPTIHIGEIIGSKSVPYLIYWAQTPRLQERAQEIFRTYLRCRHPLFFALAAVRQIRDAIGQP